MNIENIRSIAQSGSPQELIAALLYQQEHNSLNEEEIVNDLIAHPDLWYSFFYSRPMYAQRDYGIGFSLLAELLLHMSNYQYVKTYNSYLGDNLFILTEDNEVIISQLLDLGKKWKVDEVYTVKSCEFNSMYKNNFEPGIDIPRSWKLKQSLINKKGEEKIDGAVVCLWWDYCR